MLPKPYFQDDAVTIYHGDCREIMPLLGKFDLLLTDPPYGFDYDPNRTRKHTRVVKGMRLEDRGWEQIIGEKEPFDPAPFLLSKKVILFGANHFSDKLPSSKGWLVWDKRDGSPSDNQSDCELAWCNFIGRIRMYSHLWRGIARAGEDNIAISGPKKHPHQKPIELIRWCISLAGDVKTIIDPFAGSGTTGRAAKDMGRKAVLIEIEEEYCEIAARRMAQQVLNFG